MNGDIDIREVLERHAKWLEDRDDRFMRANLAGEDLSGVNLRNANLSDAYLNGSNLRGADLRQANLKGAVLSYADLSNADLSMSNLSYSKLAHSDLSGAQLYAANLHRADLEYAELRNAVLESANLNHANLFKTKMFNTKLTGAVLRNTDLVASEISNASMVMTSLDPHLHKLQRRFVHECPPLRTGGRIVYRTKESAHVADTEYVPGRTYVAPHLSFSVETGCHPGIYAASMRWMRKNYRHYDELARCYVRDGDWVITEKGAIRCKRLRVLEIVDVHDVPIR